MWYLTYHFATTSSSSTGNMHNFRFAYVVVVYLRMFFICLFVLVYPFFHGKCISKQFFYTICMWNYNVYDDISCHRCMLIWSYSTPFVISKISSVSVLRPHSLFFLIFRFLTLFPYCNYSFHYIRRRCLVFFAHSEPKCIIVGWQWRSLNGYTKFAIMLI